MVKTWLCIAIAGGLLLTLLGVSTLFLHELRQDSASHMGEVTPNAKRQDRAATPEPPLHRTIAPELNRSIPSQRLHVPALPSPHALSAPQVSRTEPDQPRFGQPFALFLTARYAPGEPFEYQFRESPADSWRTANHGQIHLNRVGPGPLHMEFRVVDSKGRSSPVMVRTWMPAAPAPPVPQVARLRAGEAFYQEVIFDRQSQGQALGIDFRDNARFALLSRFHVDKVGPDGSLVSQKIEAVHVARALPALEGELNRILRQTRGITFRVTLNRAGEVARFEGNPQAFMVKQETQPGGLALWMQSTLDADAWKELAGLTFFQPRRPLPANDHWSQPLRHHWGPLGEWNGQAVYSSAGHTLGLERYDYQLDLKYHAPDPRASGLPFGIGAADFRLQKGGGSILYDAACGRVRTAEEQFQVRGKLTAEALGVTAPTEMAETQRFELNIFDQVPTNWRPLMKMPDTLNKRMKDER